MVAWIVALNSWRLLGTMEMRMPRELKATPIKMALDLQITWHNLVHFCCAKICHSKLRLFLIFLGISCLHAFTRLGRYALLHPCTCTYACSHLCLHVHFIHPRATPLLPQSNTEHKQHAP